MKIRTCSLIILCALALTAAALAARGADPFALSAWRAGPR